LGLETSGGTLNFKLAIGIIEITEIVSGLFLMVQEFYWATPLGLGVDSPSKISYQEQNISLLFLFLLFILSEIFVKVAFLSSFIFLLIWRRLFGSLGGSLKIKVKAKLKFSS
jgi:hypothetical protein